jgi:polyhydroxybutyrate depolymerase
MLALRLASLLLLLLGTPLMAQERLDILHDGKLRTVLIDAAPGVRHAPLVITLHGGLAGPRYVRRRAAVTLPHRGWVVAWPAAEPEWNDGRRDGDGALYNGADDIGFLRALVVRLAQDGLVDPAQVYVAGVSLGGTMALRLVCDAPDLVRGAAVALAALPVGLDCPEDGPAVPLLLMHGTADPIMPPGGGPIGGDNLLVREILIRDRGQVRSVAETAAFFASRNGCDGYRDIVLPDRDGHAGTRTVVREYTGCAAPLIHYIVDGGGHAWPGTRASSPLVGAATRDFSATAVIERFFESLVHD